jgi:hypothetical protein
MASGWPFVSKDHPLETTNKIAQVLFLIQLAGEKKSGEEKRRGALIS